MEIASNGKIQNYPRLCKNDDERRERFIAAQKRYNIKDYKCELCDIIIKKHSKAKHEKMIKHLKNIEAENSNKIKNQEIPIK